MRVWVATRTVVAVASALVLTACLAAARYSYHHWSRRPQWPYPYRRLDTQASEESPSCASSATGGFAWRRRAAVILRGGAFRHRGAGATPCDETLVGPQQEATQSLINMIVAPLEETHAVDIFVVDSMPTCKLTSYIIRMLNESRNVFHTSVPTKNQAGNVKKALDFFKEKACGTQQIQQTYRQIIVTRLDLFWKMSIKEWPTADLAGFNFFSKCERLKKKVFGSKLCVADHFHMMNSTFFSAFDSAVRNKSFPCFRGWDWRSSGHGCYTPILDAVGKGNLHFITPWIPRVNLREFNDIADFPDD